MTFIFLNSSVSTKSDANASAQMIKTDKPMDHCGFGSNDTILEVCGFIVTEVYCCEQTPFVKTTTKDTMDFIMDTGSPQTQELMTVRPFALMQHQKRQHGHIDWKLKGSFVRFTGIVATR